jgi:GH24 family phage-related lysozyme (muramidase)
MTETISEIAVDNLDGSNEKPVPPKDEEEPQRPRDEQRSTDEEPETRGGPLTLSRPGAAFIARFEGCVLKQYNDPVGHCTIGIGHLIHHGHCNGTEPREFRNGITTERAVALLQQDARRILDAIRRHVRVALRQHEVDALCSWGFNCGVGVFQTSTLVRKLNAGDRGAVPGELAKWSKAGNPPRTLAGLLRRRKAEGKLFAHGRYR